MTNAYSLTEKIRKPIKQITIMNIFYNSSNIDLVTIMNINMFKNLTIMLTFSIIRELRKPLHTF